MHKYYIYNSMRSVNIILVTLFFLQLCSCSGVKHMRLRELKNIPIRSSVKVANTPLVDASKKSYDTIPTLLSDLLGVYRSTSKVINLTFKKEVLVAQLNDSLGNQKEIIFEGKYRKKRRCFEYNFYREVVFIPFIYGRSEISRVRIGFMQNGKIVVDDFNDNSVNYFILAGGSAYTNQYFFKTIE